MFDLFGSKELERDRRELQKSTERIMEFHERLRLFLLALKELHNPDVDKLFEEHQVEVRKNND